MNALMRASLTLLLTVPVLGAPPVRPMPWLGMGVRSYQDKRGQRYLHVEKITPAGPAATAGLHPGDIILSLGAFHATDGDDLDFLLYLQDRRPGERLVVRLVRAGRQSGVTLAVGVMPDAARPAWNATMERARQARIMAQRPGH